MPFRWMSCAQVRPKPMLRSAPAAKAARGAMRLKCHMRRVAEPRTRGSSSQRTGSDAPISGVVRVVMQVTSCPAAARRLANSMRKVSTPVPRMI